jgi:hypothetical protein
MAAVMLPTAFLGVLPMSVPAEVPPEQGADVPAGETTETSSAPTTTIPEGCIVPTPVQATFVGEVTVTDRRTARFNVVQMRGGSLEGFTSGDLVDVDYSEDVRFVEEGQTYIVAAGVDQSTGRLFSKVRDPEPLLGSSQVIGLNSGIDCPEIEDAVRTLTMEARPVDSGVLTPLRDAQSRLVRSVVLPVVWVLVALIGLATLKAIVSAMLEASHRAWNGEPVLDPRSRRRR